jgi:hypothetical protein
MSSLQLKGLLVVQHMEARPYFSANFGLLPLRLISHKFGWFLQHNLCHIS